MIIGIVISLAIESFLSSLLRRGYGFVDIFIIHDPAANNITPNNLVFYYFSNIQQVSESEAQDPCHVFLCPFLHRFFTIG